MYNEKNILALIPARGGSKGVPRKNIRPLGGKPLIEWTIKEAKKSKYVDRLILSSEDEEIISVARECECDVPFVRPVELAADETPGIDPVLHAIESLDEKYDYLVLLQPTSPFRTSSDIDEAIELCIGNDVDSCVSTTQVDKHPAWMFHSDQAGYLSPFIEQPELPGSRQLLDTVYVLNGAVYVVSVSALLKHRKLIFQDRTIGYPMPCVQSMDIDTELDFELCEFLAKRMERGV